jgi:hypothetical protein
MSCLSTLNWCLLDLVVSWGPWIVRMMQCDCLLAHPHNYWFFSCVEVRHVVWLHIMDVTHIHVWNWATLSANIWNYHGMHLYSSKQASAVSIVHRNRREPVGGAMEERKSARICLFKLTCLQCWDVTIRTEVLTHDGAWPWCVFHAPHHLCGLIRC